MRISDQYAVKAADYFDAARTEIRPLLPQNCKRVLEIGCAAGATMTWMRTIRSIGFSAGVELVAAAAEKARSAFDQVFVLDVEADELPFPPASFDTILALEVLEHLVNPWRIVKRLHTLLAPGGYLIASVPNVSHFSVAVPLITQSRWDYADDGLLDRTHLRFFVEKTAVQLMSSSGLTVDMVEYDRRMPIWIPTRFGRWYTFKIWSKSPLHHLIDFRFLLRARASA